MRNDEIEILEDFSDNQSSNNKSLNQAVNQESNQTSSFDSEFYSSGSNSVDGFDNMIDDSEPNMVESKDYEESPKVWTSMWDQNNTGNSFTKLDDFNLDDDSKNEDFSKPVEEPPVQKQESFESVDSFDAMISGTSKQENKEVVEDNVTNNDFNQNIEQPNSGGNNFVNDSNNDLVQPDGQDLTITAVYPNGFAIDQKEELENTLVIKPQKKGRGDLYLIIIVSVLAITLVVLILIFYVL